MRGQPEHTPVVVPDEVKDELLCFLCIFPLLSADLSREFEPLILTSDASPDFGFGVAVRRLASPAVAEALSRLSIKRGDFLVCEDDAQESANSWQFKGVAHKLPFPQSSFSVVMSVKAKVPVDLDCAGLIST